MTGPGTRRWLARLNALLDGTVVSDARAACSVSTLARRRPWTGWWRCTPTTK